MTRERDRDINPVASSRIVDPADHMIMPWKNGLGTTREIAIDTAGSDVASGRFRWRLSIATIDRSCPFSPFPGYDRTIMLIGGNGMILAVAGRPDRRMDRLFEPYEFSGGDPADCVLLDGPVDDFNLMVDRSRLRSETTILRLSSDSCRPEFTGSTGILHCLRGELDAVVPSGRHERLGFGETLIVEPEPSGGATGLDVTSSNDAIAVWFDLREASFSR